MVLKTFNLDEEIYNKFSEYCKENGISMSKQINFFIKSQIDSEFSQIKKSYLNKLREIEKEKGIPFKNMDELRKIIEG